MKREMKAMSRLNWETESADDITIATGALMRIADAAEKTAAASEAMAANYNRMKADKEMYERWYQQGQEKIKKLEASNASLRGVITRLKNEKKRTAAQELPGADTGA